MLSTLLSKKTIFWLSLVLLYLVSHLIGLTKLPVFADEAIYIRWSQLILDDSAQYLFFALNDGKTPLFVWQLVPMLGVFSNPLYAGRVLSVLSGLLQVVLTVLVVRELKGNKVAQLSAAAMVLCLPFWFFHHRMALMDGWMVVWLTAGLLLSLRSLRRSSTAEAVVAGVCIGASLLTKVPAVLALPSFLFLSYSTVNTTKHGWGFLKYVAIAVFTSGVVFASLILSPSFSQLFNRGGDFLFSVSDIFEGVWFSTIKNTPSYFEYFWKYATPPVLVLFIAGLFSANRKLVALLWLSFLAFYLPIALMGVVVFPRYLLPCMVFVTIGAAVTAGQLFRHTYPLVKWSGVALVSSSVLLSLPFMYSVSFQPEKTPFVASDKMQYLTEWSAGYGVEEVYLALQEHSKDQTIAVATEGYFGTLPDGLLLYLHNKDVKNIAVQGVGQPITAVPEFLLDRNGQYQRFWLVVNSNRRQVELPPELLLASYCRPFGAPCLELWDLTELVASQPKR